MRLRFIFCFLVLFVSTIAFSQTKKPGKVEIIQDSKVNTLVDKHIAFNENLKGIQGYRIQIYFDSGNNSKSKALSIKSEFSSKYPEVGSYVMFQEPNYKVRVGDFRNRIDATRFLKKIYEQFQNAFIVKDEINLPDIYTETPE
ncbi:MAG: SPOR domain-containing protein [Bacteroidetes bacterium]|nr:SPOR domain-containing protein [Bacteroidota bacterium]